MLQSSQTGYQTVHGLGYSRLVPWYYYKHSTFGRVSAASDEDNLEEGEDADGNKKKKKRKKPIQDDGRVFGVTIHRSDRLKTDLYIAHPLVRVHMVDVDTGAYVKKSKL